MINLTRLTTLALALLTLSTPAHAQFTYVIDDGSGGSAGPVPGTTGPFVWGNVFSVQGDYAVITSISVALGTGTNGFPAGQSLDVLLYQDPTADGDPRDAVLLTCARTTTPITGQSNAFTLVPITPTRVQGQFFAAARATLGTTRNYARTDPQSRGMGTWLFWGGAFDGTNLASSATAANYINLATVMVRADATNVLPCLADVAGPGQTIGPDGQTTADDIIVYLNWFFAGDQRANIAGPGQSGCPDADLTADDIIVFLNRFFAC
jgi:hypothetical protein